MVEYKHRELQSVVFLGERIDFVASNDRMTERVSSLSHERDVLSVLVKNANRDDVVWDVGACLGIHSFVVAKHLPDGRVYSFEPMHANRAVCVDNKAVNELDNVHVSRSALSDENGQSTFEIRESIEPGFGRHSLKSEKEYESVREITVPTKRGDTVEFEQPNIVKIDVEGASPLVLDGMRETLSDPACRIVVLETHEPNPVQPSHEDFGMTRDDIIAELESMGFQVDTLDSDYHLYGTKNTETTDLLGNSIVDVSVIQSDISEVSVDAIINSAGTSLRMGTGVAGSLKENGGVELYHEALEVGPVDLGSAVVTDAYELDSDIVIHAASMPHYGDGKSTEESVRQSVRSALELADERQCQTVALPAVGCGLGGVSLITGATTIFSVLNEFEPEYVEEVQFVLYSDEEYETVTSLLD